MKYVLFHFQLSIQIKLKDLLKCTILEMIKTIYAKCSLVLSTSSSIVIGLATIFYILFTSSRSSITPKSDVEHQRFRENQYGRCNFYTEEATMVFGLHL